MPSVSATSPWAAVTVSPTLAVPESVGLPVAAALPWCTLPVVSRSAMLSPTDQSAPVLYQSKMYLLVVSWSVDARGRAIEPKRNVRAAMASSDKDPLKRSRSNRLVSSESQ